MAAAYFAFHEKLSKAAAETPEADQLAIDLPTASVAAYRARRDRVMRHHMADARELPLADPARLPQEALEAVSGSPEAWAAAQYAQNDEYQFHTQHPPASVVGREPFDRLEAEVDDDCGARARELVAKHILNVFPNQPMQRGAVVGVTAVANAYSGTYLVPDEPIALHVWKSRKEARRFHEALRRAAQAKFEHMVPSPVHVPLAGLVAHQGALVSVVWLPPVTTADAVTVGDEPMLRGCLSMLAEALSVSQPALGAVFSGADARLYLFPRPRGVLPPRTLHRVQGPATDAVGIVPRGVLDACDVGMDEDAVVSVISSKLVPVAAKLLAARFQRFELQMPPKSSPVAVAERAVDDGVVRQVTRSVGLGCHWLYSLLTCPAMGKPGGALLNAITSEIVLRCLAAIAVGQFRTARIADAAATDVHHVSRIVAVNHFLEPFATGTTVDRRRFIETVLMPVARAKFAAIAPDVILSVNHISFAAVMRRVGKKLALDVDVRSRSFLRFAREPVLREVTHHQAPSALAHHWGANAATAARIDAPELAAVGMAADEDAVYDAARVALEEHTSMAQTGTCQHGFRTACLVGRLCRLSRLLPRSRARFEQASDTTRAALEVIAGVTSMPPDDAAACRFMINGVLCDIGNNSHIVEDAGRAHAVAALGLLPEGREVAAAAGDTPDDGKPPTTAGGGAADEAVGLERLRVTAARLITAAPSVTDLAMKCFDAANASFRRLFRFGGFDASSTFFEMRALEAEYALKTAPLEKVVAAGYVPALDAASAIGADQDQRVARVTAISIRFAALYASWLDADPNYDYQRHRPTEPEAIATADGIVGLTTLALKRCHAAQEPSSGITVLVVMAHVLALVSARHSELSSDESGDALPRSRQLATVVREGFDADEETRKALLDAEWTAAALGLLVTTAMGQGQWHAAGFVLSVLESRFEAMVDPDAVGYQALRRPVRLLQRAHDVTLTIAKHYRGYVFRAAARKMRGLVAEEALHATGVVEMERMSARTFVHRWESQWRLEIAAKAASIEIEWSTWRLTFEWADGLQPMLVAAEGSRRAAILAEEADAFDRLFDHSWRLGRHRISSAFFNSVGAEHFALHWPGRRYIEALEARAFVHFMDDIELNARRLIVLGEQHAMRQLFEQAAVAVLRRVAQSQLLVRAVPSVSLYFFSEEEDVRVVLEEEAETMWEEMRLKEKIFRMAALREARVNAARRPKVFGNAASSPSKAAAAERTRGPRVKAVTPSPISGADRDRPGVPEPLTPPPPSQRARLAGVTPPAAVQQVPPRPTEGPETAQPRAAPPEKAELYRLWAQTKRRAPPTRLPPLARR